MNVCGFFIIIFILIELDLVAQSVFVADMMIYMCAFHIKVHRQY